MKAIANVLSLLFLIWVGIYLLGGCVPIDHSVSAPTVHVTPKLPGEKALATHK